MKTLHFLGYTASVHFSRLDNCFFGKIDHINDLITFETEKAENLQKEFEKAVSIFLHFLEFKDTLLKNEVTPYTPKINMNKYLRKEN